MSYKAVIKDALSIGKTYGIDFQRDYAEISKDAPDKSTFREFKVTNSGRIAVMIGVDEVSIECVPEYLKNLGIDLDENTLTALGLTLDRTADTIKDEGKPVKCDWNVTVEKTTTPKPATKDIYESGRSLRGRAVQD